MGSGNPMGRSPIRLVRRQRKPSLPYRLWLRLHGIRVKWDPTHTYYWYVDAKTGSELFYNLPPRR